MALPKMSSREKCRQMGDSFPDFIAGQEAISVIARIVEDSYLGPAEISSMDRQALVSAIRLLTREVGRYSSDIYDGLLCPLETALDKQA